MVQDWQAEILVTVPSVNGGALLARMLPTLPIRRERVIVLDQGSTDETEKVCRANGVEIVQLSTPRSWTEACNIGVALARERRCSFVCLANNDITFQGDVLHGLWREMQDDPTLAIAAPSQVIFGSAAPSGILVKRVSWRLGDDASFHHDFAPLKPDERRLEADFCELTCALLRLDALTEVGGLDNAFGFYHEDADLGFRLREAGWGCAYLPQLQIHHHTGSTVDRHREIRKDELMLANRRRFARKHLGPQLRLRSSDTSPDDASQALLRGLGSILDRYGLLSDSGQPLRLGLAVGRDGPLLTDFDGPEPPPALRRAVGASALWSSSRAFANRVSAAGLGAPLHVPLGVDTDTFAPWGEASPRPSSPVFLAVIGTQEMRTAGVLLEAWRLHHKRGGRGLLRVVGPGHYAMLGTEGLVRWSGAFVTRAFPELNVEFLNPTEAFSDADHARLLRGADHAVHVACSEGSLLPALQAMACGVPPVLPDYGAGGELALADAVRYSGTATSALWLASARSLADALAEAEQMSPATAARLAAAAPRMVRSNHTLRHTAMAIRAALLASGSAGPASDPVADAPDTRASPGHLGRAAARYLRAAGYFAGRFADSWETRGLSAACAGAGNRLRAFIGRRLGRVSLRRPASAPTSLPWLHRSSPNGPLQPSTLLLGYLDAQLGLGESARGLAAALATTNVAFALRPIGVGVEGRRSVPFMLDRVDQQGRYLVNVLEVTPDELPRVLKHFGHAQFSGAHNILRTYWELPRAPNLWRERIESIQELWAPNSFVAGAFRHIFTGPITLIPPCVDVPDTVAADHAGFGLRSEHFHFLFSFDLFSFPQRKNPLGLMRAFREAFPDPRGRERLVLKISGGDGLQLGVQRELLAAAVHDERILLIHDRLSRAQMLSLIATCDCYASLHRSEGFGYGMAEALALGRPVVATDWSGSKDFLSAETGFPVAFRLRDVREDEYVYARGQVWAEPDPEASVAALREVASRPDEAAQRAARGKQLVRERYAPAFVGRAAAARLHQCLGRQP